MLVIYIKNVTNINFWCITLYTVYLNLTIMEKTNEELQTQIKQLKDVIASIKKEKRNYKKAFNEVMCYFDSISDEEQPKLLKKIDKIFK